MATKKTTTTTTPETPSVTGRLLGAQKRVLDLQRSAFESGYNMVSSIQERQEEAVTSWLERSERIPAEVKELTEAWIGAGRKGRETYRDTVERSFELVHTYIDGLSAKRANA